MYLIFNYAAESVILLDETFEAVFPIYIEENSLKIV